MESVREKAGYRQQAFKCEPVIGDANAWCMDCHWFYSGIDTQTKTASVCANARKHTQETGHETRIDIMRQRGYRALRIK